MYDNISLIINGHNEVYKVHTPTNAPFITLDKVLKFTLDITLIAPTYFGVGPSSGSLH